MTSRASPELEQEPHPQIFSSALEIDNLADLPNPLNIAAEVSPMVIAYTKLHPVPVVEPTSKLEVPQLRVQFCTERRAGTDFKSLNNESSPLSPPSHMIYTIVSSLLSTFSAGHRPSGRVKQTPAQIANTSLNETSASMLVALISYSRTRQQVAFPFDNGLVEIISVYPDVPITVLFAAIEGSIRLGARRFKPVNTDFSVKVCCLTGAIRLSARKLAREAVKTPSVLTGCRSGRDEARRGVDVASLRCSGAEEHRFKRIRSLATATCLFNDTYPRSDGGLRSTASNAATPVPYATVDSRDFAESIPSSGVARDRLEAAREG
ncbi:hypothetical protein EV421DRAFT_1746243 [Armillaria borealis]|uniref:Uncharacterized protein n=1 Tax=Armillaria borealis TaxID=47425 RepID=A0AA39IEU5_9AGAR|nr:hypothetical protein EV421DRAFT_1746243 [Armillaria borealis]